MLFSFSFCPNWLDEDLLSYWVISFWSSLAGWRPFIVCGYLILVFIDWMKTFYRMRRSYFGLHRLDEDLLSYSVILFWSSSTWWRPFIVIRYLILVFIDWMKTFYRIRLSHFGLHRLDEDLLSYSVILFWSSSTGWRPFIVLGYLILVFIDWMKTFYRYSVSHFGLHWLDEDLLSYAEILFWSSSTGWRPFIMFRFLILVFISQMQRTQSFL